MKKLTTQVTYTEIVKNMKEEEIFSLPNDQTGNYQGQKQALIKEL